MRSFAAVKNSREGAGPRPYAPHGSILHRADRVVRPYKSATGGAMWASPPTRNMKLQQDGASRTPPPTKFYHSSVRRGRRPCPPAKFVPSSMQKPLSLRGRSAPVAIRIPRPLLHAKKEDASRHPLFYTIESLENYFSSTLAPTSSSSFFMFSASSLDRASFRVVGVSSTAFLASARPRPVISRTDLMTLIF